LLSVSGGNSYHFSDVTPQWIQSASTPSIHNHLDTPEAAKHANENNTVVFQHYSKSFNKLAPIAFFLVLQSPRCVESLDKTFVVGQQGGYPGLVSSLVRM
jgi:hypothetical protein